MDKSDLRLLYDYYYWANARILACAGQLQAEQFTAAQPIPHGSLRGVLMHMLNVERTWRTVTLEGGLRPSRIPEGEISDAAALSARWQAEEQTMRKLLAGLPEGSLDIPKKITNSTGVNYEWLLWQPLYQVLNHGTQHRSEAAVMLTELGQSPGDIDFIFFLGR
jgi:uncharacterized damage-inducible protein DinB